MSHTSRLSAILQRRLMFIVFFICHGVFAYLRMPCGPTAVDLRDPIVKPGVASFGHVHAVAGAGTFEPTISYETLQSTQCTTCAAAKDKSLYWTPHLYFYDKANSSILPVNPPSFTVYYRWFGKDSANIKPFPQQFRMIAGDKDLTQAPAKTNIFYQCINGNANDGTKYKGFPQGPCNSVRGTIIFPSCLNKDAYDKNPTAAASLGKDSDSTVRYTIIDDGQSYESNAGACPSGYDYLLPTILLEVWWDTSSFASIWQSGGYPVLAQGDSTGYGLHADFIMGWDITTFDDFVKTCAGEGQPGNGEVTACSVFSSNAQEMIPNGDAANTACHAEFNSTLLEVIKGTTLPGGNAMVAKTSTAAPAVVSGS